MKPYPQYKDSGIDWLGEVPEEWKVKKMKYISTVNPTKESDFDKTSDEMVTFLPMENVSESGQVCCDNKKSISSLSTGFTYFKKHDVIIAKITPCFENGKGALLNKLDTEIGFGSTEFHVLRAVEISSPAFLFYITRTYQFRTLGEAFMTGAAGQKRVPTDFIEEFFIALPSLSEQTTIAAFLDRKTAEIDIIIAKKERLIELYEEEKAAVINHAVTKGLDPAAKMKDSGIEWLGEIPKNWEVIPLKYIGEIKYGLSQLPTEKHDGLPVIRATNIFRGKISKENLVFVNEQDISYDRDPILKENDIIVVRSGAYTADSAIILKEYEGSVVGYDMVLRCNNKNESFFMSFCLLSDYVLNRQLLPHSLRAAQPHLNREELGETRILRPKENEQTAIVQHIETKCSRIDAIISKFKRQIELLKEYRTALISEAVTGKIDLRNKI